MRGAQAVYRALLHGYPAPFRHEYGEQSVAPQDPLTLILATGTLLLVALIAAYLPARQASRVDPIGALHQT